MDIGIPRERRSAETRVAVTPMGAYALVEAGHRVFVEADAGADAGFSDEKYDEVGATVVFSPPEVYGRAELIAKVQPPDLEEIELMNERAVFFSALQLGARVDEALRAIMKKKIAAVGYEMLEDENVSFVKGKVAQISEEPQSQDLLLDVEDTLSGDKLHGQFDLVVLATGVVPSTVDVKIPFELTYDEYGFIDGSTDIPGVYAVGCAKRPCDVSRATKDSAAAALKAVQCLINGE